MVLTVLKTDQTFKAKQFKLLNLLILATPQKYLCHSAPLPKCQGRAGFVNFWNFPPLLGCGGGGGGGGGGGSACHAKPIYHWPFDADDGGGGLVVVNWQCSTVCVNLL